MVNSCCVKGCHNRQDREKDRRFFCIPSVVNGKGKEMQELTSRRRREWLAQLKLKNFNFQSKTARYVCSDHFVNGAPAYIRDVNNPSWKPTQKLGHGNEKKISLERYKRLCARNAQRMMARVEVLTVKEEEMDDDSLDGCVVHFSVDSANASVPPPDTDDYGGTYCQTDLDGASQSTLTLEEKRRLKEESKGKNHKLKKAKQKTLHIRKCLDS